MSKYNVNLGVLAERIAPPSKRAERHLAWYRALLQPLQKLTNFIFKDYRLGGTDYISGEDIIGIEERMKYNGQAMVLEAILNKVFKVWSSPYIYIVDNVQDLVPNYFRNLSEGYPAQFFWGDGSGDPSWSVATAYTTGDTVLYNNRRYRSIQDGTGNLPDAEDSLYWELITKYFKNEAEYLPAFDFTIMVPLAVYTALGTTTAQRTERIRAEAGKYVIAGVNYNIQTY